MCGLLIGEGIYLWPRLHESWKNLTDIHWGWVAACVVAEAVSLSGFGRMQKQLLHAGHVEVSQRRSLSVIYASTAMSVTLPAGQVFSTGFTYRETRRWGASPIVASWQLAISGVIAAVGLALLGFAGAILAGGSASPFTLIFSIGGILALFWAGHYATRHPTRIDAVVRWCVARFNAIRRHPADDGLQQVRDMITQLESVEMRRRDAVLTTLWAVIHRMGDVACLGFACLAVGADPRLAGVLIAFAFGKAVGTIPFAPGGIVYVDATLIASLTSAAGLPAAQAVAAAFVYRGVSFILVAMVGWVVFLFLFRGHQSGGLESDVALERAEAEQMRKNRAG
ncbi:YbhN family protein [Skermania piniformis]|uniref:YbhN family protein n=1 Tax=Skermania pinensis TaxID=39122 RepID=A0ABX8SHE8_9ACTN|nr:YbhN family protein [Skermania piniformis]